MHTYVLVVVFVLSWEARGLYGLFVHANLERSWLSICTSFWAHLATEVYTQKSAVVCVCSFLRRYVPMSPSDPTQPNRLYYRVATPASAASSASDTVTLARAIADVQRAFPAEPGFSPLAVIVATWYRVSGVCLTTSKVLLQLQPVDLQL